MILKILWVFALFFSFGYLDPIVPSVPFSVVPTMSDASVAYHSTLTLYFFRSVAKSGVHGNTPLVCRLFSIGLRVDWVRDR